MPLNSALPGMVPHFETMSCIVPDVNVLYTLSGSASHCYESSSYANLKNGGYLLISCHTALLSHRERLQ